MNFYNNTHPYYCGIDLHARSLYVYIIDQAGDTCLHKQISAAYSGPVKEDGKLKGTAVKVVNK